MRQLVLGTAMLLALPLIAGGQASASLSGRVVVESTEDPIVGAEISIDGQMLSVRSDSAGRLSWREFKRVDSWWSYARSDSPSGRPR